MELVFSKVEMKNKLAGQVVKSCENSVARQLRNVNPGAKAS